jgi:quercetin dioxygenase-like cupin family protein
MQKYLLSNWLESNVEQLDPKLSQRVFTTSNVMVVHYIYEPGLHFDAHSHPQEQITLVQSGRLVIDIEGETVELKRGDICCIFPNVKHSTLVLGEDPVESINIFTPVADQVIIHK